MPYPPRLPAVFKDFMKLTIYVNQISTEHFKLLTKYGYTIIFKGWGEVKNGTLKLSV